MKPHRATVILVLGILSLVVCGPLGIFAWIMGRNDMKQMDDGTMDSTGRGTTQAGKICGMIATILMAVGLCFVVLLLALGVIGGIASGHHH